jgi:transcriptional regulator GlxA family with amidase domain
MKLIVGILLFRDVELLDFAGPYEVFSVASELNSFELFDVFSVAKSLEPVVTINGLSVNPKYSFANCPTIDLLVIPGGVGARRVINDQTILDWISEMHASTKFTLSVCTGAMILGKLGLLNNAEYTTHHLVFDDMKRIAPKAILIKNKRYIKNGKIYTAAGISAGIDLSLHIVGNIFGQKVASQTARYMEYPYFDN